MHRTYKGAIIGSTGRGNYGHGLDIAFNDHPAITVVAVADPDPAGRAAAQLRCHAPRAYADYREMLSRERPDVVAVGPRWTDARHAMVRAALESGAHVYCEKPFTATLAEADDLIAFADRRHLKIAVAHQTRLNPGTLFLKQQLDTGLIGDLLEIRITGKQDQRAGGEDMIAEANHQFGLARFCAGDALWCAARVNQRGREATVADIHPASEGIGPVLGDEIAAAFAFPGGVNVSYTSRVGYHETGGPYGMMWVGSRGVVRMFNGFIPRISRRELRPAARGGETEAWLALPGDPEQGLPDGPEVRAAANRRLVDDLLAAIEQDREPASSGRAAMRAIEMSHAVFASALAGGRVALPLKNRRHPLEM